MMAGIVVVPGSARDALAEPNSLPAASKTGLVQVFCASVNAGTDLGFCPARKSGSWRAPGGEDELPPPFLLLISVLGPCLDPQLVSLSWHRVKQRSLPWAAAEPALGLCPVPDEKKSCDFFRIIKTP